MKTEKNSMFKKFLTIYILILVVLMIAVLSYVADSLIKYEKNQIENYIETIISDLKKVTQTGSVSNHIDTSKIFRSEYEKESTTINQGFAELLNSHEITYKLNDNSKENENPIYDIYADENKILEVYLDGSKKENRLGLFTFNNWKTTKINATMENGLYTSEIIVPNNFSVYINGKQLTKDYIIEENQDEGLAQISKYVEIPYIVKYEVSNLLKAPDVKILDKDGKKVEYKQEGNTISKQLEFISVGTEEEAKQKIEGEIDILKIAKDWSLYLTDDLEGNLHGYYNISKYLIKNSDIKKSAYKWATGEDINFVSSHILLNPTFTDEEISNFEIYSERAFSCEVYLQKNLKLKSGGKIIEDKMNERMYFAYYDESNDGINNPEWKLVNMQSVATNNK